MVDEHDFKKLSLRSFPKLDSGESSESGFWRKYQVACVLCSFEVSLHFYYVQFPITVKHDAPVSNLHFSPSSPHDYAVTSGPRVSQPFP